MDDRKVFGVFILIICLINLPIMSTMGWLSMLNNFIRILAAVIGLFLFLVIEKGELSKLTVTIIIMQGVLVLSTVINGGNILAVIASSASVVAIAFIFEHFSRDILSVIKGLMLIAEIFCYANFITLIMAPRGLYISDLYTTNWLLGYKNQFAPYLLLFCLVAYIHSCIGGNKLRSYGIYGFSLLSVIMADSSTSIVGIGLLLLLYAFVKKRYIMFDSYLCGIGSLLIALGIHILDVEKIFSFFIEGILGKAHTFSLRLSLWERVGALIAEKPILGHGVFDSANTTNHLGVYWAVHAHNMLLQYLYQGGLVYLIIYLIIVIQLLKKIHKVQNDIVTQGILITILVFWVMSLTEVYSHAYIFIIYYLAYNVEKIIELSKGDIKVRKIKLLWGSKLL